MADPKSKKKSGRPTLKFKYANLCDEKKRRKQEPQVVITPDGPAVISYDAPVHVCGKCWAGPMTKSTIGQHKCKFDDELAFQKFCKEPVDNHDKNVSELAEIAMVLGQSDDYDDKREEVTAKVTRKKPIRVLPTTRAKKSPAKAKAAPKKKATATLKKKANTIEQASSTRRMSSRGRNNVWTCNCKDGQKSHKMTTKSCIVCNATRDWGNPI